ncbi:Hypothetical protein PBC10988_27450 [Planctomycetales bacterium 10988]|nr:Hypothetical protein PBC10988_27450 [Planctomycetales bacterium 10988]
MKIFFYQVSAFVVSLILFNPPTFAADNFFLPGDAYFPTELTEGDFEALGDSKLITYSSLGGYKPSFNGYAGYGMAKLESLDDDFLTNLKRAYQHYRSIGPREAIQRHMNGKLTLVPSDSLRVLIYPKGFIETTPSLGIRYNERWMTEVMKFGHPPENVRLCCLIDDKDAVIDSWRNAERIPPLPATLPKGKLEPQTMLKEPILIQGPIVAIVLHPFPSLEDFFYPIKDNLNIIIVDSESAKEFQFDFYKLKLVQELE